MDKSKRFQDVLVCWFFLGTIGMHQFYLGNKKRGLYLLFTSGLSHFLLFIGINTKAFHNQGMALIKLYLGIIILGYILGLPVLFWDLIRMPTQVRNANGVRPLL
ncbi:MAG: TM2 domain-containing protein [Bdellovibrio sp.]|nr:TM2 domain-containing protein [Bdellovibrio sp.]